MSEMFDAVAELVRTKKDRPIIVVAGGGQWALEYAKALHWFIAQEKALALFVYESRYGLGHPNYHRYLKNTLTNMIKAEELGAKCIDLGRLTADEQKQLPTLVLPKAVFVVTPPETHCEEALRWAPSARSVFIEKPFDAERKRIELLSELGPNPNVFGFDHYAARLKPFLSQDRLKKLGFRNCSKFVFEMFEAAPRGLEERSPSVGATGMIFDMASHAVPILSWIAHDVGEVQRPEGLDVVAGTLVSPNGKRYIETETFASVTFQFRPKRELGGNAAFAEIRVGKGVGPVDCKVVTLTDDRGEAFVLDQWFMLAHRRDWVEPIHEKVIHRLVVDVIEDRNPLQSDGVFGVDLGCDDCGYSRRLDPSREGRP